MSSSTKSVVVKQKKVHPSTPVSTPSASRLVREGFELQPQIFVWTIWTNFCLYIFVFFYISVIKVQYTTRLHSYLLISAKLLFSHKNHSCWLILNKNIAVVRREICSGGSRLYFLWRSRAGTYFELHKRCGMMSSKWSNGLMFNNMGMTEVMLGVQWSSFFATSVLCSSEFDIF